MFLGEYREVLADKLIKPCNANGHDGEIMNIELLKIRFGEDSLHACEIMLKDVQDSKRINTQIHQLVDMMIISAHYWPSIPRKPFTLHTTLADMLSAYTKAYAIMKKPRQLAVIEQLGSVELELEFTDGSCRAFTVTPLQANCISLLEEASSLTNMSAAMDMEEQEIATAMSFWIKKGVVKVHEDADGEVHYEIIEEQAGLHDDNDTVEVDYDSFEAQEQAKSAATKAIVEEYVQGLLKSHGSMGVDRLCSLLQLILKNANASATDTIVSNIASLQQFLRTLVDRGVLEVVNGLYSLTKQ